MSSRISVKGSLYAQDTENGKTTDNIPFEIYSDYSTNPTNTYFRQLHFSNVSNVYMGISNVGSYFYVSAPSNNVMTEQSNTFIVTSGGNVGIGKTDPSDDLHVEGKALVRESANVSMSASVSDNIHASNFVIGDGDIVVGVNANHRIPSGTIALWENKSTIPDGWSPYNAIGSSFVRGSTNIGTTGGAAGINITKNNFPVHNHNVSNNANYGKAHAHSISANIIASNAPHSHTINVTTNNTGAHTHTTTDRDKRYTYNFFNFTFYGVAAYRLEYPYKNWNPVAYNNEGFNRNMNTSASHSHDYRILNNIPATNFNHSHVVNVSNNTNVNSWSHGSVVATSPTGTDDEFSLIPSYKSYVFIIKD